MIVPSRFSDHVLEQQIERRNEGDQHEQLSQFHPDVERQQRRQQVRAGKLQRLPQREREPEPVHEPNANAFTQRRLTAEAAESQRKEISLRAWRACGSELAPTIFSSAM
jgi:hypothetical protein